MASSARIHHEPLAKGAVDSTVPEVNLSQIQEWNKCRYRWSLTQRRNIKRRSLGGPMDVGTAVHAGIAGAIHEFGTQPKPTKALYRRVDAAAVKSVTESIDRMAERIGGWDRVTEEEAAEAQRIMDVGVSVVRRAIAALHLPRWRVIYHEDTPLVEKRLFWKTKHFLFHGTPDLVAEDLEEGGVWVIDYKVRKAFTPVEAEEVNVQFPAYQYLLARNGIATTGSLMFQAKAQAETVPKLNQNGSMSRAKVACTWDTYMQHLIDNNLDPEDYRGDMQSKLDTEFFRSTRTFRNEFVVNAFWKQIIVPAAHELLEERKAYPRSMNHMNCMGCGMREFCLAELMGEDTDFLLATTYEDGNAPVPRIPMRPTDFILVD